jgi:predicted dehydrogenase
VSVHSPPFLHARHVRAAVAAGKAVMCDKPFALDAGEAAELEAEANAAGVVALCNFEFRYAPARVLLRDMVHDGSLGTVEHVQWLHHSAGSRVPLRKWGWLFDRALGGGWVGAWASHAVDNLRYVLDTEVITVQALLRTDIRRRPDDAGAMHLCTAEDGLTAGLGLANGATVAIDSSFAAVADVAPRLTMFGTRAVAEVVADEHVTIRHPGDERGDEERIDLGATGPDRHLEPMRRFAEVVRDAVTSGAAPDGAPTFADGRACDVVLDRLRAAPFASARD